MNVFCNTIHLILTHYAWMSFWSYYWGRFITNSVLIRYRVAVMLRSFRDRFGIVVGYVFYSCWYHFVIRLGIVVGSCRDRFGIDLDFCWNHFRVVLDYLWDRFRIVLGLVWDRFWNRFGISLGSFWGRFDISLGSVWGTFPSPPHSYRLMPGFTY